MSIRRGESTLTESPPSTRKYPSPSIFFLFVIRTTRFARRRSYWSLKSLLSISCGVNAGLVGANLAGAVVPKMEASMDSCVLIGSGELAVVRTRARDRSRALGRGNKAVYRKRSDAAESKSGSEKEKH